MNYTQLLSERATNMRPSGIRKFFDIAAEMKDCITLGVGEPDFSTPAAIRDAGIHSLQEGHTFYTSNTGMVELREEICHYLQRRFSLSYDAKTQTLVTVGGSEGIDLCIRALVNPGDEVILPEPCFVSYHPITSLTGGVPVSIPLKNENRFKLTADELKKAITPRTKLLVFPFPSNPTGGVMRKEELEEIAEVLRGTDITVLSDEIYAELTYGNEEHVSIAQIPGMYERTLLVNGFSKSYAMTGWRLGYVCGPAPLVAAMNTIHQAAIMCAPTTSQYAAIVALREGQDDIKRMREEYNQRRLFLMQRFSELNLPCFEPEGAFYVFPDIRGTGLTSAEFCERLLKEYKVAVVPGTAFGECGEGFIRISYAYSLEHLTEAFSRIEKFLQTLQNEQNRS